MTAPVHRSPDDPDPCWACGQRNDATTAIDDNLAPPGAGDVAICFGCGELAIHTGERLHTREPTDAERAEMLSDANVVAARGAILADLAERPPDRRRRE